MGAMKLQAPIFFAIRNPREGAKVGEAHLHRFMLHVQEGGSIEFVVAGADLVAGLRQHPHPVADEMPFTGRDIVELAGERRGAPPHMP